MTKNRNTRTSLVQFGLFPILLVSLITIVTVWLLDWTMANILSKEIFPVDGERVWVAWNTANNLVLLFRVLGLVLMGVTILLVYLGYSPYKGRVAYFLSRIFLIGIFMALSFSILPFIGLLVLVGIFLWSPKRIALWTKRLQTLWRVTWVGGIWLWALLEIALIPEDSTLKIMTIPLKTTIVSLSLSPLILLYLLIFPIYVFLPRLWVELWGQRAGVASSWKIYSESRMGLIGLGLVSGITFLGLFADFIAPYHWDEWYTGDILAEPNADHLFGTNQRGMDIFSRVIYGSRVSLVVGFTASALAIFIGTAVGLLAGYYRGWLDTILMRITDVFLSLPSLPFMLIFVALFGKGLQNIIIVIAILGWTGTARMVRSETLSLRERPLTEASYAIGATDSHIILRHIIPNTLPLILANVVLGVVNAVLGEAGLTFLGFGDIFGHPSWGIVLHFASKRGALISGRWWWIIPPGLLIMLLVLGFAFISHAFDQVANPRLRRRR